MVRGELSPWCRSVTTDNRQVGWGLFNLVEGIIDHHILGIHHVRSGEYQTWWDIGFLVFGALLVAGGWLLQRTGKPLDLTNDSERPATPR